MNHDNEENLLKVLCSINSSELIDKLLIIHKYIKKNLNLLEE